LNVNLTFLNGLTLTLHAIAEEDGLRSHSHKIMGSVIIGPLQQLLDQLTEFKPANESKIKNLAIHLHVAVSIFQTYDTYKGTIADLADKFGTLLMANIEAKDTGVFFATLDILSTLHKENLTRLLQKEELLRSILGRVVKLDLRALPVPERNYKLGVVFQFFDTISEVLSFVALSENIIDVQNVVGLCLETNAKRCQLDSFALISMMAFIRKSFPFLEVFQTAFQENILNDIIEVCAAKILNFDAIGEASAPNHESVDQFTSTFMIEFSETLSR
jgi:hypothetical protein